MRPMSSIGNIFRSLYAFLFTRTQKEDLVAEYVVREHRHGRSLDDILDDPYVRNRCTPEQVKRVLERPELVHAIGEDIVAAHLSHG
jgi:hypothetical protein